MTLRITERRWILVIVQLLVTLKEVVSFEGHK